MIHGRIDVDTCLFGSDLHSGLPSSLPVLLKQWTEHQQPSLGSAYVRILRFGRVGLNYDQLKVYAFLCYGCAEKNPQNAYPVL